MATTASGRQRLREWLVRSVKTQHDLAVELAITDPYLSQVLAGLRRPKLELLMEIERVTGVPIESWAETDVSDSDSDQLNERRDAGLQRAK